MSKFIKTFTLALLFAALFVFTSTSSVFADDGAIEAATPAPTEVVATEVATAEPVVETTPVPTAEPADALVPTEAAGAEATPEPEAATEATQEPVLTETPAAEETPAAVGDSIVLADESGDPLPLTSTETSELLQGGDPYFMVGTQKYAWVFDPDGDPLVGSSWQSACPVGTVAGATCFEATSTNAINAALNYISDHGLVPTDKKIYVEAGIYDESVSIDGTGNIFYRQFTGLIGVNGSAVTTINGDVNVSGTLAGFTLSGFTVNGGVNNAANTGTLTLKDLDVENGAGDGIIVSNQKGAVTITDVESSDNQDSGLMVNNGTTTVAYPVTITNSEFNDNDSDDDLVGYGAKIYSKGAVTLNGVSASNNSGVGMFIDTPGVVTVKNGDFSGNIDASALFTEDSPYDYWGEGLEIHNQITAAAVTLENIHANGDGDCGIWVMTRGPITAKNVVALGNTYQGMFISHDFANYNSYLPTTIIISDSEFFYNGDVGLQIFATGNVTLTYINANSNGSHGVFINNCLWNSTTSSCKGTGAISILNPYQVPMTFNYNGYNGSGNGLYLISGGAVTITGISANDNAENGVYVKNNYTGKLGAVTINSLSAGDALTARSNFNANGGYGIYILSNGSVALNGSLTNTARVNNNGTGGIHIGDDLTPSGSSVSIKGFYLIENNGDAVWVSSKGAININTVWINEYWNWSDYTSGNGFTLDNTSGVAAITITNAAADYVGGYGFYILSKGPVSMKSTWSYRDGATGIFIDNSGAAVPQPVTLIDTSVDETHGTGIDIRSKGTVNISGADSYNNSGINLDPASVQVNGYAFDITWFNFTGQAGHTVEIDAAYSGEAYLNLVNTANGESLWSNGDGFWYGDWNGSTLDGATSISLPVDGEYYLYFDWNTDWQTDLSYVLNFKYDGVVPVSTVTVPQYPGILVDNTSGSGDVNITGSAANPQPWVSNNTGSGIIVASKGNIKLLSMYLHRNQKNAVYLTNSDVTLAKNVTVGNLDIHRSGQSGLVVYSIGAVAMTNILSNNNGGDGINVDNCYYDSVLKKCKGAGAISLTGSENSIYENQWNGIKFTTIGTVTLNNITSNDNRYTGLFVAAPDVADLAAKPATGGVILTSTGGYLNAIHTNGDNGISIYTFGPVSLQKLDLSTTQYIGLYINNNDALTAKPVTLTDVAVWDCEGGIVIYSLGTVTLNGVNSDSNYHRNPIINYGESTEGAAIGEITLDFEVPDGADLNVIFTATGGQDFVGAIDLFDADWNWVDGVWSDSATFSAGVVSSGGTYHLKVSPEWWNAYSYKISVSDPTPDVVENFYNFGAAGIYVNNSGGTGDVIVGKSPVTGKASWTVGNAGDGLRISTNGNVRLTSIYSASNLGDGFSVYSNTQGKTFTITDISSEHNGGFGVYLINRGSVTWTKGYVYNNDHYGVMISNTGTSIAMPVTLTNVDILETDANGLGILSKGIVTLRGVEASDNHDGDGADINNSFGSAPAAVIVDNATRGGFSRNGQNSQGSGLVITSKGSVTLINVDGSYNNGDGINVNTEGPITIYYTKDAWVTYNSLSAINAYSGTGAIKLSTLKTLYIDNDGGGIALANHGLTAPVTVEGAVNGVSLINLDNDPIEILSDGVVTVRNVSIKYADGTGLKIAGQASTVNLTNIIVESSGYAYYPGYLYDAVVIEAKGAVNVFNLNSSANAGSGLVITTNGPVSVKKTITAWNGMRNAADDSWGTYITTPGNIILDSVISKGDDNGIYADNTSGNGTITMLGTYFKNEVSNTAVADGSSLIIHSNGAVSLTRLDIHENAAGAYIKSENGKVTLNTIKAQKNLYGIFVWAGSGAAFTNVLSMGNGWWDVDGSGIKPYETDGINVVMTGGAVAFTDSTFIGNTGSGIEIKFKDTVYTQPFPLTLIRTLYFGNDSDVTGDRNLNIYKGTV